MTARYKSILLTLAMTSLLLVAYFFVRPGVLERSYLANLEARTTEASWILERSERKKPLEQRDFPKFKETLESQFGPLDYLAVFDKKSAPLYRYTLDRDSELFYSITQEIQAKKLAAQPEPLVRYYNQKKFYVFIRDIHDGSMALSYSFRLSRRDLTRIALELALILLFSISAGTISHIVLYRRGEAGEYHPARAGGSVKARKRRDAKKAGEVSEFAAESLKNYVFDLFTAISSDHAPDSIALYIMNREATRMVKAFEMKGHSFIRIDSGELDVIELGNEIGSELKRSSTLVLNNGNKVILPILHRNSLLGAVNIIRGVPFNGLEIRDIKALFGKIAQFLSEYIFYNDVVTDANTGLYSAFYFRLKYAEALNSFRRGASGFAVLEMALFRDGGPDQAALSELVRGISRRLLGLLADDDLMCLREDRIAVLLPGAGRERALAAGDDILRSLSGLTVRAGGKPAVLKPYVGAASTDMLAAGDDPLEAARVNLEYALLSEESAVESSKVKNL